MTFMIYLLSQHPDVLARVRAEVLENVGPSAVPTYDNIRNMKYLRAVINGKPSFILYNHHNFQHLCHRNVETLPGRVSIWPIFIKYISESFSPLSEVLLMFGMPLI